MYDVGKILTVGGAPDYQNSNATTNAFTIDITGGSAAAPVVGRWARWRGLGRSTTASSCPMGRCSSSVARATRCSSATPPPRWRPSWTRPRSSSRPWRPMSVPRNYHSVALLLPDARVLSGGGGLCGTCATNHADARFSAPLPLRADGSRRPGRSSSRRRPGEGRRHDSVTTQRSGQPVLARALRSVTHTVDTDERRIPLSSTAGTIYVDDPPRDGARSFRGPTCSSR